MIDERDAIDKVEGSAEDDATQSSSDEYKVGPGHPPL